MFWTYKVPLFRLLVPKLSSVNFLGAASVLLSFIPKCAHSDCYTGYLLLPSHPSLPLKGQSQALILEYLVKNTFMSATVKSTLKKCTQLHVVFGRATLCLPYIRRRKWQLGGKKPTYISTTIISGLSHLFAVSLCCFVRLTTGNKFFKQEAWSEDPWGMYIGRSAAWASHKPLFSKAGCYCRNVF